MAASHDRRRSVVGTDELSALLALENGGPVKEMTKDPLLRTSDTPPRTT